MAFLTTYLFIDALRIDDVIPSRGRGAPMPQREESGMD